MYHRFAVGRLGLRILAEECHDRGWEAAGDRCRKAAIHCRPCVELETAEVDDLLGEDCELSRGRVYFTPLGIMLRYSEAWPNLSR